MLADLIKDQFSNVDRRVGLDFEHLKIILAKIAKYHAGTAVMIEQVRQKIHSIASSSLFSRFTFRIERLPMC